MLIIVVPSAVTYCAVVIVSLEVHSVAVSLTTFCDPIQWKCVPRSYSDHLNQPRSLKKGFKLNQSQKTE